MARIVIASQSEDNRLKISRLLSTSGYQVFRCCSAEGELRRALSESEDCVVVMVGFLQGCKPDDLIWDYGDRIQLLLIARQQMLEDCESQEIFRLVLPASAQMILGAVEMLTQLHRMRLPRRSGESKETVERAKALLMKQKGLSEPEAHRMMQQYAMNHGMKMAEFAERILKASNQTEEGP